MSKVITTPTDSKVVLNYARMGKLGLSQVEECADISGLTEKFLRKKISAVFHMVKNTEALQNRDGQVKATVFIDGTKSFYFYQKKGDYEKSVFSLIGFKEDGTEKRLRKISYEDMRKFILKSFGFLDEKDSDDTDVEGIESGSAVVDDDAGFDEIE